MMPKSTATSRPCAIDEQIALDACRRGRSRRAARGAGSDWMTAAAERAAGRSPAASSAARSVSGDAVDPFQRQDVARRCGPSRPCGTRKSGSSLVFSAISDSAAASSRRSISIATERASVSTTSTSRRRRASARIALGAAARRSSNASRSRAKRALDAGPQHLHRDGAAPSRRAPRRDAPARSRRRRPASPKRDEELVRSACRARLDDRASASACGNGAIRSCSASRSRATRRRRRRAASPGTGRA